MGAGTCDPLCKAAAAASIAAIATQAHHSLMTPATLPAATAPAQRSRWTTEDVEPRHALAYWVETVCRSFLELDVDSPDRGAFRARLDAVPFGSGSLYLVQANTQYVRRTPRNIASGTGDWTILMQIREGQQRFRQHGRECELGPGDCTIVDCAEPYELDCNGTTRSLVMRFPREWLATWLPSPAAAAARAFGPGAGWGGALSAAMAGLENCVETDLQLPPGTVADQLAGLVALAAGPEAQAARPQDRRYQQLRNALRERCLEADLSPTQFATSQGISRRYLYLLFARAGTTFGEELMRLRLDAAHRLLSDRRCDALTVLEVASRCGFAEPSHFARRFRGAYGLGPLEFRKGRSHGEGML
jgi:AraC family transcriptional regulator, positive regulator of tynA and feaB